MTMDYSITWAYIVDAMKEKFGISPDNTDKHSFYEIERMMDIIWNDHVDVFDKKYGLN